MDTVRHHDALTRDTMGERLSTTFAVIALFRLLTILPSAAASSFSLTMTTSSSSDIRSSNRVVVVGSANQDLTCYTATMPVWGETVLGRGFQMGCGGKGANQANAAASLKISPVTMICRTGDDVFGQALLQNFRTTGVQLDEATTVLKGHCTGVATIIVDTETGDNRIIVTPGANHELKSDDVQRALSSTDPPPAVVLVQLEILPEAAWTALKVAKEMGTTLTVLNPAPAPEDGSFDKFWPYVDICVPNESELRTLCGKMEDDISCDEQALAKSLLLEKNIGKAVIVTLGARGALVVEKDGIVTFCSEPPDLPCRNDPVVDTIGAGDAFCGALATYMSAGTCIRQAAVLACGFAGMSVRRQGANYPTAEELPDCLRIQVDGGFHNIPKCDVATKPTLIFVTGNKNKLDEVQEILGQKGGDLPLEITNQNVNLTELQGGKEKHMPK